MLTRASSAGPCTVSPHQSPPVARSIPVTLAPIPTTCARASAAGAVTSSTSRTVNLGLFISPLRPIMRRPPANGLMSTEDRQPPDVDDVAPLVYNELRRIAAAYMRRERPGQTLQATALVHEAYLRLANVGTPWTDKRHFVGIAARSMRQILVERARSRGAQKRWAGLDRVTLTASLAAAT